MPVLEVRGISMRFRGVLALREVDLDVESGTITGLIGPNGAGKTSLFNIISGVQAPTAGSVRVNGRRVTNVSPHRRAKLGIARTFQRIELFGSLTALENIRVAAEVARRRQPVEFAKELLQRLGIADLAHETVGNLSTGSARLVEVARALATEPKVLLLDEPASGLDEQETLALGALLRQLRSDGLTVLIVEHDMTLVMDVCDRIYVLDLGMIIASGTPREIQRDPEVLSAYLGAV